MNKKSDLQIWNNAAFDNGGDSEDSSNLNKPSWPPLKSIFLNPSDSLDSFSSKENRSPKFVKFPVSANSPVSVRQLHPNGAIANSQKNPIKSVSKHVLFEKTKQNKIDEEIEEIEKQISRLSSRLEMLKLERAQQSSRILEKQKRVVKKIEENLNLSSSTSVGTKIQRRGFSMGPTEIMYSAAKSRQLGKQEIQITPLSTLQSRRKSCFWKLQDIEEERGRNLSLSPKSKKPICKTLVSRQAVTTVGAKKGVKKEDGVLASVQPKKLFMKDGEKSVPGKKTVKPGRIIASRYNHSTTATSAVVRKRSLPEDDMDESKRCEKKCISLVGKSVGTESRVKKKWEIPSEIVVPKKLELEENSPPTIHVIHDVLPKIKAVRLINETPRNSGPAKRVAELVGRKSYFCEDEELEGSVCQTLSFAEDFEDDEN